MLDLDTIKSALLESGATWSQASSWSYATIYALVDDLLGTDGARVIVDTPSYWVEIHQRLTNAADRHHADYLFLECLADEQTRSERLARRPRRRSQIRELGINPVDAPADTGAIHRRPIERPVGRRVVEVDTVREVDLDGLIAQVSLQESAWFTLRRR